MEHNQAELTFLSNLLLRFDSTFPSQPLLQLQARQQRSSLLPSDVLDHEAEGIPRLSNDIRMRGSEKEGEIDEVKVGEVVEVPAS